MAEMYTCPKCQISKELNRKNFRRSKNRRSGFDFWCKSCRSFYEKSRVPKVNVEPMTQTEAPITAAPIASTPIGVGTPIARETSTAEPNEQAWRNIYEQKIKNLEKKLAGNVVPASSTRIEIPLTQPIQQESQYQQQTMQIPTQQPMAPVVPISPESW